MNKKISTLVAGFLLATAFASNVGAQTAMTTLADFSKDTYYLIGDGTNGFLKAVEGETSDEFKFTSLAATGIANTGWKAASEADKLAALWRVVPVITNGNITGVNLINKKTGAKLVLKDATSTDMDVSGWAKADLTIDQFDWFAVTGDKFIDLTAAVIKLGIAGATTPKELKIATAATSIVANAGGTAFGLYTASTEQAMTANDLNKQFYNGFKLNAKGIVAETNSLFNQKLTAITITENASTNADAVKIVGSAGASKTFFFAQGDATTTLLKAATNGALTIDASNAADIVKAFKAATVVAVDKVKSETTASTVDGYGYKYTTATGEDLLGADNDNKNIPVSNAWFDATYDLLNGTLASTSQVILRNNEAKFPASDGKMSVAVAVRPQISTIGGKSYLIVIPTDTKVEKWAEITFNTTNKISYDDVKGSAYSVTVADKKEASKNIAGYTIHASTGAWAKAADFLTNRPEGQWVVTYNTTSKVFTLNNRETGKTVALGANIYKVENAENLYYVVSQVGTTTQADTLKLTPQTLTHSRLGGYANGANDANFTRENLAKTAFMLGVNNAPSDKPVFVQNSGVHNNTLTVDVKADEGLSFYLVPVKDSVAYGVNKATNKYYEAIGTKADSLRRIPYVLQERKTKRFVTFNTDTESPALILNNEATLVSAQKFFLKEKENGQYVLAVVNASDLKNEPAGKIYVNVGSGLLHQEDDLYKKDIADEFGLYVKEQPKYADILKEVKADSDTALVAINLTSVQNLVGNSAYMLASDNNNFLVEGVPATNLKSVGGLPYDSIKFSIMVDTAYINRAGNTMPLYYLAMNGVERKVVSGKLHPNDKDEFGHTVECTHYVSKDTVYGKYLFAMYDSIVYAKDKNIKKEDYCYHYTNTDHFARLRFVDAKHISDTMIVTSGIASKDTLNPAAVTTNIPGYAQDEWMAGFAINEELQESAHIQHNEWNNGNYGLFAFEINPDNNKEYAIYNPASGMYVAYLNGNVVMAPQASYYTTTSSATGNVVANEDIEASTVKVEAGQGNVTISGAAGKKVVISNVLGQIVANTVISSDDAVIAAPAGVAVVAVEGETAVKAIVK